MSITKFLKRKTIDQRISDLGFQLASYKDLYKQASESRDFWKDKESRAIDLVHITQNKLRDEVDLCDKLSNYVHHITKNYKQFLTQEEINQGKLLSQIHLEARRGK